jgi:hypothetical protein
VIIADLAQLFVLGLLLDLLLFEGVEVVGLVRLAVIAALLVAVLKSHGWLVLLALQASLFMREPRRPEMMLGLVPWLYGLTSICLVAYAYLGKPFRNHVSKWLAVQTLFTIGIEERTESEPSQSTGTSTNWIRFLAIQFLVWMVITMVAMLALLRLPISATARSEWLRSAIENNFTVWPGATLLVLALLLVIVFMEAGWRQMTGAQARLYLRSSFILDHYRDLRMIVVRRLKNNKTLARAGVTPKQLVERVANVPPKA